VKHVLSIPDLGRDGVEEILGRAASFVEVLDRPSPKVPALRGKTIANMYFEASTRTRTSFELAGKLLSADVINFSAGGSSLDKGESLRDTIQTIGSMGFDALVIRHGSSGVPHMATQWIDSSIINAGDGAHQHPTQGLLDALTLRQQLGRDTFEGVRMAIVGDIAHSRVTRSAIDIFSMLGADITLVAPPTLLPPNPTALGVAVQHDLDEILPKTDVIYTIRPQQERIDEALIPYMSEYITRYTITNARAARLDEHVVILEAGPLIRGIQMADRVADSARNLMNKQVRNGVAVRMACLFLTLHGSAEQL
jgi:aspartate carbamoyltransferase catalytic subunit